MRPTWPVQMQDLRNRWSRPTRAKPTPKYRLGRLYLDGSPSNPHQAALWFQLAVTKGDCRAAAVLGDMLFQGRSVPREAARGLMWLTLSKDCARPEETWVKPLYDYAFRRASEDERAMALVYLEDWLKGRRDADAADAAGAADGGLNRTRNSGPIAAGAAGAAESLLIQKK
jgi:TPR repeat protein